MKSTKAFRTHKTQLTQFNPPCGRAIAHTALDTHTHTHKTGHDQLVCELTFCYLILFKLNLRRRTSARVRRTCNPSRKRAILLTRASARVFHRNAAERARAFSREWSELSAAYQRSRLAAKRRQWQMNIEVKCGCCCFVDVIVVVVAGAQEPLAITTVCVSAYIPEQHIRADSNGVSYGQYCGVVYKALVRKRAFTPHRKVSASPVCVCVESTDYLAYVQRVHMGVHKHKQCTKPSVRARSASKKALSNYKLS